MSAMPYVSHNFLSFFFTGGVIAVCIAVAALFYVFFALGLYTMAKRRGLENPWLAWVPVAYLYTLGKLADAYAAQHMNKRTNYALVLLLLVAGTVALAVAMVCTLAFGLAYSPVFLVMYIIFVILLVVVAIVYAVFYYIALYRIYNWHSESATVLLVLSILFSVIVPFVLFALRNGDNRYLYPPQPPAGQPFQPRPPAGPQGYNQ